MLASGAKTWTWPSAVEPVPAVNGVAPSAGAAQASAAAAAVARTRAILRVMSNSPSLRAPLWSHRPSNGPTARELRRAWTNGGSAVGGFAQQRLVLLVLVRPGVERDDRVLLVERVLAEHRDPLRARLDHVVAGLRLAAQARGRHRAGVHHEQVLEPPRVRHVLVAGQHQVHVGALQALERVTRVVHHVALASSAGHRQQVVVQHEDAQEGLVRPEALLDPLVPPAAD